MELISVAVSFAFLTALIYGWRLLSWVWLRPKKLERCLRMQGLAGNPYRFLHGDFRDISRMIQEAYSKPISFSDDIAQRVIPFFHHSIQKYGMKFVNCAHSLIYLNIYPSNFSQQIFGFFFDLFSYFPMKFLC